jgi:hypothetical protein
MIEDNAKTKSNSQSEIGTENQKYFRTLRKQFEAFGAASNMVETNGKFECFLSLSRITYNTC